MGRFVASLFHLLFIFSLPVVAQQQAGDPDKEKRYLLPACIYKGDTIPCVTLPTVHIFKPMVFKNERHRREYDKLVRNVKRTLPLSKEIKKIMMETYEYIQTLPDEKSKERHIKLVEKGVREQYTPIMKKLSFSQGKLLIKLVDRECNQSSYELVRAFLGSFRAGFYQTFASLFGASLKKQYDPTGDDILIERIAVMVENGQL